jgi:hypothetical protein
MVWVRLRKRLWEFRWRLIRKAQDGEATFNDSETLTSGTAERSLEGPGQFGYEIYVIYAGYENKQMVC